MKQILLAMLSILLFGCASLTRGYSPMTKIKIEDRKYQPVDSEHFSFENKEIKITYAPVIEDPGVNFKFENKSKELLQIIWDETTFISELGESKRVLHTGVKLVDKNQSQPPSAIPPGANMSDTILPVHKVYWQAGGSYVSGFWRYEPLCGEKNIMTTTLDDGNCIGKTFGYFITYKIGDKKKNASLKFKYISRIKKPKK